MVIVFANTKGGVGKSTLATHLAVYLVDRGNTVALLDVDEQRSSSQWALEAEPRIIVRTAGNPDVVAKEVRNLQTRHDFVIADAPGRVGDETRTLMLLSDLALFPMTPSILDLRSVARATETLKCRRFLDHAAAGDCVFRSQCTTRRGRTTLWGDVPFQGSPSRTFP